MHVAQTNRRKVHTSFAEFLLVFAQLRNMFAAENSPVVPQKHQDGRIFLPQRAEPHLAAACFGQTHIRKPRADGFRHVPDYIQ